jgi:hypothetical protein
MGTKAEAEARAKYEAFLSQLRNMHVRIRGRDRPLTEEERRHAACEHDWYTGTIMCMDLKAQQFVERYYYGEREEGSFANCSTQCA